MKMKIMFKILLIFGMISGLLGANKTNYCQRKYCRKLSHHIACGDLKWGESCPREAAMVDMEHNHPYILNFHNMKRNAVAGGYFKNFPKAARMATVSWDKELAHLAKHNVVKCFVERDQCRRTDAYRYVGQSIGLLMVEGTPGVLSDEFLIKKQLTLWWNEFDNFSLSFRAQFPRSTSQGSIGHFALMINEQSMAIGCAAIRYYDGDDGATYFLFTCNYSAANKVGHPVYVTGQPGRGCKKGTNIGFSNLCHPTEVYELY